MLSPVSMYSIHAGLRHGIHSKWYPMHVNARKLAHGQNPSGWSSESPPLILAVGTEADSSEGSILGVPNCIDHVYNLYSSLLPMVHGE
jgi:hypothetical protein